MAEVLKLEYGKPETIALKFDSGKEVQGRFGPQVAFSAVGTCGEDKIIYLDRSPAAELERGVKELGIRTREYFRVVKVKEGNTVRLQLQRIGGTNGTGAPASHSNSAPVPVQSPVSSTSEPDQAITPLPVATRYMGAYAAAIDTLCEAKAYAQRKGIAIEIRCEDIRCLAATMMIDQQRGGAR